MSKIKSLVGWTGSTIVLLSVPLLAYAKSFKELVDTDVVRLGNSIISLLYALSFIVFLIGMVRLFFSANEESRQKGKSFALYGILGLVVLFAVWGFVRVMLGILGSFNT